MNHIEVDFQSKQHTFILPQEMAAEVEYIQIGGKAVHFEKTEIDNQRTGIILQVQGKFPRNIFYELEFLNKKYEIMPYEVQKSGMTPFFARLSGVVLCDQQSIFVKFLHVDDLFVAMDKMPIICSGGGLITNQSAIALDSDQMMNWRNYLLIATQQETGIRYIVSLLYQQDQLIVPNKYVQGPFQLELLLQMGEHSFRLSFSETNDEYIPLKKQVREKYIYNHFQVQLESYDQDYLILQLDHLNDVTKIELLTDTTYSEAEVLQEENKAILEQVSIDNVREAVLFIYTDEFIYMVNMLEDVLSGNELALGYIDKTIYNFHMGNLKHKEDLAIKDIQVDGSKLIFSIHPADQDKITNTEPFLLVKLRKKNQINYIRGKREQHSFTFDFSYLLEQIESINTARWDFFLINDDKSTLSYRIGYFEEAFLEKPERFYQPFKQEFSNNSTYKQCVRVYITENNELAMQKNNLSNLIKEQYKLKATISNFDMKRNHVNLNVNIISPYTDKFDIGSLYLIQRNKDTIDKRSFNVDTVSEFNGKTVIQSVIDLSDANLYPLYWDLYIGVIDNNKEYFIKISSVAKKIIWDVNETISKYQFNVNETDIIYPYITLGNDLSFTYREKEYYENRYYLLKENLAFLFVKLFANHYKKKNIWLAFEKLAMSAHDSGYYFFDYVYKNKKHDEFYYIIQKDSPEMNNLADKKDKVIYFMSFKYFVYMFAAQLLISSDTKRNSYNLKLKKSRLAKTLTNKKLVYLQHGVNGLKRVRDFHKDRNVFDLVIAPSEFEKQMIINDWGYDESEVVATGLARWDGLRDKTEEIDYKQIFLMPTWRTWMDGMEKEKFVESEYFQKYNAFLSSPKLHALLEENNVKLKFFLHPKFRDYIDLFDTNSPNIEKFGFLEVPMDEMIMHSSLMISDYSSVIWEMFYLKKPCVFFHFDKDKYLEYEGTYMDLDNDLFGDVTYNTDELLKTIEYYVKNNFKEKEQFAELRNEYFTFMDHRNSERIYQAIEDNEDWLIEPLKLPRFKLSHLLPFRVRRKILDIKNNIFK
ncbi:CDP-glycerol glycerophosphotransferase family protein [Gracilibacillus alcaliphilus]|uniref:CDP-glycerol glycerophosphotransferase family protein n=1 Tax=Gracilibacillus alcaliphilus TaxID=1401441 RepID=UPI00195C38A7|nr:CDP-glycerol glycerophosphotransferase family protein [Gracilibacillus alcaliphilus]MBM7678415.1 CDP-glycerol glycerophosphotransferase (TagB/SpsB family) [Gracilibacillus alcaliphilus]